MKDTNYCIGCENNFYNNGGVNGMTKECWSLKNAKLIMRKKVHIDQTPPWKQKPSKVLSCYHQKRCVFIEGDGQY